MERMYYKKHNCMVDVFSAFQENHIMALIYSPSAAGNNNGNGWMKVRAKELIPEQYFDGNSGFISKSYRTRIKDRLTLVNATWMASDGKCFDDAKEAFEYEENIYKNENHYNEATEE